MPRSRSCFISWAISTSCAITWAAVNDRLVWAFVARSRSSENVSAHCTWADRPPPQGAACSDPPTGFSAPTGCLRHEVSTGCQGTTGGRREWRAVACGPHGMHIAPASGRRPGTGLADHRVGHGVRPNPQEEPQHFPQQSSRAACRYHRTGFPTPTGNHRNHHDSERSAGLDTIGPNFQRLQRSPRRCGPRTALIPS